MPSTAAKNISINIVFDNNPYKRGLSTSWGFACLIRGTEKTILFDTGSHGRVLLNNMKQMGIDPDEKDVIVLSHVHGDHTGGLEACLKRNDKATVYYPDSFPREFQNQLQVFGIKAVQVHDAVKICHGVYSTGVMGSWIKEQSLLIHTDKGIIVITGCAHPGIVEIVDKARALIADDILLVMGGFHLAWMSSSKLAKIASCFKKSGVKHVGPCHCSGDLCRQVFRTEYGHDFIEIGVGRRIEF